MIVADTSGLLALYNRAEPHHQTVKEAVAKAARTLIVSPYVVAEVDYLLATRLGVDAELAALEELSSGAYDLACLSPAELRTIHDVVERYRDQAIGVADASLVVLADRFGTKDILTLDRRHFAVLRPMRGGRFRLIP